MKRLRCIHGSIPNVKKHNFSLRVECSEAKQSQAFLVFGACTSGRIDEKIDPREPPRHSRFARNARGNL